jgi:malate synthase
MLFELGEYSLGLNCGRWDYLFSVVKKLGNRPEYLFPERGSITMTAPLMRAYCRHTINVCHAHGAYAMGGSAVQIPIEGDAEANAAALATVRADKEREAGEGFDGTWVAHPGLVATASGAFGRHMAGPNNLGRRHPENVTAAQLLEAPRGTITEAGVRWNLHAGVRYLEAWLRGEGAEPIRNLMEELATAEISRAQLWQWRRCGARLEDGRVVDAALLDRLLAEELAAIRAEYGAARFQAGRFPAAAALFMGLVRQDEMAEFLSVPAYELLE